MVAAKTARATKTPRRRCAGAERKRGAGSDELAIRTTARVGRGATGPVAARAVARRASAEATAARPSRIIAILPNLSLSDRPFSTPGSHPTLLADKWRTAGTTPSQ